MIIIVIVLTFGRGAYPYSEGGPILISGRGGLFSYRDGGLFLLTEGR